MTKDVLKQMQARMERTLENLRKDLARLRTGRANISILDKVMVECYGTLTPVNQIAALSAPDPRLIVIQPWDANLIGEIERAILSSDLGFNPSNDGRVIRLKIPVLTQKRREEIVKVARRSAEEGRIALRNERRCANDELKRLEKEKTISQDEMKKSLNMVQDIIDGYISRIDDILGQKERDIMEV